VLLALAIVFLGVLLGRGLPYGRGS
jgi:hypothetical protein